MQGVIGEPLSAHTKEINGFRLESRQYVFWSGKQWTRMFKLPVVHLCPSPAPLSNCLWGILWTTTKTRTSQTTKRTYTPSPII